MCIRDRMMATSPIKTRISQKMFAVFQGDTFELFWGRTRETADEKNYVPMRGSKVLGPKKGKKRAKKALDSCLQHLLWNFEVRILLANAILYFRVLWFCLCFGETPTYAYSTTDSWEFLRGLKCSGFRNPYFPSKSQPAFLDARFPIDYSINNMVLTVLLY